MNNFLHHRHPQWNDRHEQWEFAWDNYTGEYHSHEKSFLTLFKKGDPKSKEHPYLHRKVQAETNEAYYERIMTSDPEMIMATAVDSLNGILFSNDGETQREWGGFGDVEDEDSTAYRLYHNADGKGTNWKPLMKQVAIKQTVLHRVWGLVEGVVRDDDDNVIRNESVKIINPGAVVNWWPDAGNPAQVLVKEKKDLRKGITDKQERTEVDTYVLYELDGWKRYVDGESGPELIDEDQYEYYTDKSKLQRRLPIFSVDIPMPRNLGYLLAQKQNHIYNAKSIRDFSVRNISFAFLKLVAEENQFDDFMENIKKGFRVIRQDPDANGNHEFIAPPSDFLSEAGNILDKDKEAFMESAFRSYGDAARQVTATEIRQESRSGVEAFLSLLVSSLDEFENMALFLLEQVVFPDNTSVWGQAQVKRATNFQPEDINEAMEKISNTIAKARQFNVMSRARAVELLNRGWTEGRN